MMMTLQPSQHIGSRSIQILAIVVCTSLGACSWIPKGESGLDVGIKDRGMASWYGEQFHGRQAANGEIFDMSALTAAHRTLPLGSIIRVVNLRNGKHVRVRVNDRGPYVNGRILDLSYAAADRLGMIDGGISAIQLEVIGDHRPEYMLGTEDSSPVHASLFALRSLAEQERAGFRSPSLDRPGATMTPLHRLSPNDVLLSRRWRSSPSNLAVDLANQDPAGLVIA
jgi:rare lipoprotein A